MIDEPLKNIVDDLAKKLNETYGYCALADSDHVAILNTSDDAGNDIRISVQINPEN